MSTREIERPIQSIAITELEGGDRLVQINWFATFPDERTAIAFREKVTEAIEGAYRETSR